MATLLLTSFSLSFTKSVSSFLDASKIFSDYFANKAEDDKKQALIDGNFDRLQNLSECRNATHYKYDPNKGEEFE